MATTGGAPGAPEDLTTSTVWDKVEPHWNEGAPPVASYCKQLKADLLPGTFVLLSPGTARTDTPESRNTTVARIIDVVDSKSAALLPSRSSVHVNIFKQLNAFAGTDGFLHPKLIDSDMSFQFSEIRNRNRLRDSVLDSSNVFLETGHNAIVTVDHY